VNLMAILHEAKVLQYFPYETVKIVGDDRRQFPIDYMDSFREELAKLAGIKRPDNKECYYVDLCDGKPPVYFMFKDFWMYMGSEIEPYWE